MIGKFGKSERVKSTFDSDSFLARVKRRLDPKPKCFGAMRIIAFIEEPDVMKKILKHLGLWDVKRKPRPVANAPPIDVFPAYDEQSGPSPDDYTSDPDYPAEAYF